MIDTVKLNLQEVTIKDNASLIIQPALYEHSDNTKLSDYDLFVDESGEIVKGSKAFYNHKFFNLTVLPSYTAELSEKNTNKLNLLVPQKNKRSKVKSIKAIKPGYFSPEKFNSKFFVQFSFPRWKKETNIEPIKKNEMYDVLDYLSKELKNIGVHCNIYESDVSRIDCFTNIETIEKFQAYTPIFNLLNAQRKKAIDWNGETFLWRSGEHQITCYDKVNEVLSKHKKENLGNLFKDKNILRIENRYTTKRKLFSRLQLKNIDELLSNYDYLRKTFKQDISKTIFRYEDNKIEWLTGKQIKEALQAFCNSGKRYWFREFMVYTGYLTLTNLTNPEIILSAIDEIDIKGSDSKVRVIKHRIKKNFMDIKQGKLLSELNFLNNKKTNKELYQEIKSKFLKVA